MIQGKPQSKGVPRASAICDECEREECVPCNYDRTSGGSWTPRQSQMQKKLTGMGWATVKGKHYCPTCEAKRKASMKVTPIKTEATAPEMSKRQRIEIIKMLSEVYDLDAERYKNGDTDETVADVLELRPGWVSQVRDAEFAPDGGNQNIEDLIERIEKFESDLPAIIQAAQHTVSTAEKKLAEVSTMRAELGRIKKAIGPRATSVAKVAG